jgi:resuscitation-promoting factor RpfB
LRHRAFAVLASLAVIAACVLAVGVVPAMADDAKSVSTAGGASAMSANEVILRHGDRGRAVKRLQRRLRLTADGVFGRLTERAVKSFQRSRGLEPDGVVGPLTRNALGLAPFSRSSVNRVRLPRIMRQIAKCESGGNPRAVSPDGRYRGKWQFTRETWKRLGGKGDPAKASEWVQDRLAMKLYKREGTTPWPHCGRAAARA